jgi:hypothetical protein
MLYQSNIRFQQPQLKLNLLRLYDCQAIEAKPDAVPLLVNVAPAGITKSSPLSPNVRVVPDLGDILFTFISLIIQLTPNS